MDIKQQLINIFNGLNLIEVKGQNVILLGQCMSQIMQLIQSMTDENKIDEEDNIK